MSRCYNKVLCSPLNIIREPPNTKSNKQYKQKKLNTFCKVHAHVRVERNKVADKAAKQAIDMPGMTTTKLPFTDY